MDIHDYYNLLKEHYSHIDHNWWPTTKKFTPTQLEIAVGAVLTQNTNWRNVEKALDNMIDAELTTAFSISNARTSAIQKAIRPSGFYRQKAKRVKKLTAFLKEKNFENIGREELLALNGIGHETADSIMLYALNKEYFVIDAYTRRIFSRLGVIKGDENYEELRELFEKNIEKNTDTYKEFHALIVEHAKQTCKKKPECGSCFLKRKCNYWKSSK